MIFGFLITVRQSNCLNWLSIFWKICELLNWVLSSILILNCIYKTILHFKIKSRIKLQKKKTHTHYVVKRCLNWNLIGKFKIKMYFTKYLFLFQRKTKPPHTHTQTPYPIEVFLFCLFFFVKSFYFAWEKENIKSKSQSNQQISQVMKFQW